MSPFLHIHFILASHTSACIACLSMPSLSSPLAPKGWLMTTKHAAVLLFLLSVVLFASSCEARGLRVHGKRRSSSKSSHLPAGKDVATTSLKADGWGTRQTEARSTVHTATDDDVMAQPDANSKAKVGVATSSSTSAAGTVGATPAVRALSQREDTGGFHLDYAGPRTHTPSHN